MNKKLLCIATACLLGAGVVSGQSPEPFEGTIRMAVSINLDKLIGDINTVKKSGNPLADMIAKKTLKKQLAGTNELLGSTNADSEFYTKVKGNKLAQFNTSDGSMMLLDGDKEEVYMTYPFAKAALKYTLAEYKQMTAAIVFDVEILQDSVQMLAGYSCGKAIISGKMNGQEVNHSECWYTDEILLPQCYLDIFHRPGLAIVENALIMNNPVYSLVTEIDESPVDDNTFIVPGDYKIFTQKDALAFHKTLNKAAQNKKAYTPGAVIPEAFWDF